jgi:hypothetical protein
MNVVDFFLLYPIHHIHSLFGIARVSPDIEELGIGVLTTELDFVHTLVSEREQMFPMGYRSVKIEI